VSDRLSDAPAAATRDRRLGTVDGLAQLSFLVHDMLERLAAAHGVSLAQIRLLGVLRDRRPTMHELARLLELDKSSVTGLVDRAQRRGLVARVPSDTDRRSVRVELTEAGRALVRRVGAAFEADVADAITALTPRQRDTLSGLVSRVLVDHAAARGIDLFDTDTDDDELRDGRR
jgi:DNA-binding MarR family transcriptional regulator